MAMCYCHDCIPCRDHYPGPNHFELRKLCFPGLARDHDYHCHHSILGHFQHLPSEEVAVGGGTNSSHPHHWPIYYHYPPVGSGPQERCGGRIYRIQQFGGLDEFRNSNYGRSLDDYNGNDWVRLPGTYV